jgi:hypothetical protein
MGRIHPANAAFLALLLAACGGSHAGGGFVPPGAADQRTPAQGSTGPVKLTITLPAIQPANARVDWASGPNLLSAATRSVAGTVGTHAFGPVALSASQTGCEATSGGLGCTFSIRVAPGDDQRLQLQTYASKNGTGPALATATLTLNVRAGAERFAAPHVYGIARHIAAGPLEATVHQGTWQPVPIVVYGVDAAKAPIPSAAIVDSSDARIESVAAVTLAGFVNATLKGSDDAPIACCGVTDRTFSYDGLHAGRETFTVKTPGLTAISTTLRALRGSSALATIVTGSSYANSSTDVNFVEQYLSNANGNAAPVRSFVAQNGNNRPFGEDEQGNFWVGGTHFSNTGATLGTVALPAQTNGLARDGAGNLYAATHCSIFEYAAGAYGTPTPIRRILYPNCTIGSQLAIDGDGNIFVSIDGSAGAPAGIVEFAAHAGSGITAPIRTIVAPFGGGHDIVGLDADAAGNLYALDVNGSTTNLLQFAPGATVGKALLPGVSIQTFAVDDGGGIYARVYGATESGSLEYFPPGSNAPVQIISGSNTQLFAVGAIAVPRT